MNKRSLTESCEVPIATKIRGKIPDWLSGTLFRNGPGRYEFGEKSYKHLFDGQACIQKFRILNGQCFYSNKLLETQCYKKTLSDNKLYPTFGIEDLGTSLFGRWNTVLTQSDTVDNVNVHVLPFGDNQMYAMTEGNLICQIEPNNLSIIRTLDIKEYFDGMVASIAHPHFEPDGSWILPGINGKKVRYDLIKYDASIKNGEKKHMLNAGKVIASIPSSHQFGVSYFHSFAITKNYIILLEQSLQVNFVKMAYNLVVSKPFSEALIKYPDWNSRIRVINKETGKEVKQRFYTDPLITFHHINAYEKVDAKNSNKVEICVDFCGYDPKLFKINELKIDDFFSEKSVDNKLRALAKRIIVPMDLNENNEVYCEIKCLNSKYGIEFPAVNYERFNGREYKYFYGASNYSSPFSIVKMDTEDENNTKEMVYFEEGRKLLPLEPVFVESPNATSEDDGILLVMVLSDKRDFLSILDAKDLSEIARAEIPDGIKAAITFHGFFADQKRFPALNA